MTEGSAVSTGSTAVDALLDGGLDRGAITQVYGPPAAGKSTFAMASAVAAAAAGETAVYIDTEGLSLDRLDQLAAATGAADVLDRIVISSAGDFDEQADRLREAAGVADQTGLIVLDSATAHYRLRRAEEGDETDALERLGDQLAFLLGIARRHDLAVLLTNQVFTDPDTDELHPLGGDTLAHWSATILRLDRFRASRRRLSLEKHRGEAAEDALLLEVVDGGFDAFDV